MMMRKVKIDNLCFEGKALKKVIKMILGQYKVKIVIYAGIVTDVPPLLFNKKM